MLKKLVSLLGLVAGATFACSGSYYSIRGVEFAPGQSYVLQNSGYISGPLIPADTIGVEKVSDLKAHLDSLIKANPLVFMGRIDSVIGNGLSDTVVPGLTPDYVLLPRFNFPQGNLGPGFYARIQVDTVFKGALSSHAFWIRGYLNPNSCTLGIGKTSSFLNFSNALDSINDLKISVDEDFCMGCQKAHWFDGRMLRSPDFPVISIDIRELFPAYPVAIRRNRPVNRLPLRAPGNADKAYRPDGRVVPENMKPGKNPAPIIR